MRPMERIPIVMDLIVDNTVILKKWLKESGCEASEHNMNLVRNNSWRIYRQWTNYPDLRLGQLLFNMGLTPDGHYHTEAVDWLVTNKFLRRQDVTFWGTYGLKEDEFQKTQEKSLNSKKKLEESYGEVPMLDFISNLESFRNIIPKKAYKPLSSLDTDHLQAIVDNGHTEKEGKYYNLIIEELDKRVKQDGEVQID